jgi:hypothetical protein
MPEFVNGGVCRSVTDGILLEEIGCVSGASGDFDGDGGGERVMVYARLAGGRPESWSLRVELSGGPIVQPLEAGTGDSYPRVVGAADIDGDGQDEIFVKVLDQLYHSGATRVLNVFVLEGNDLALLRDEGEEPLNLRVGGLSRFGEGVDCRRGEMVLLRGESTNRLHTLWRFSERHYRVTGARAHLLERTEGVLVADDYNDPALDAFFELRCGELSVP